MRRWPYPLIVILVLGLSGCGSATVAPQGGLVGVSTAPSVGPSAGEPTSAAPTGGTTGTGGGAAPTHTPTTTPFRGVITVTVPKGTTRTTRACPYRFPVEGTLAVDRGPVALTYGWSHDGGSATGVRTATFAGTGPQTMTVSDGDTVGPALDRAYRDELVVIGQTYDRSNAVATLELRCLPTATTPTATVTDHSCPYLTVLTTRITVPGGPIEVPYEWRYGTSYSASAVDFTGTGVQSKDVTLRVQMDGKPSLAFTVELTGGSPYTTPPLTIVCDPPPTH